MTIIACFKWVVSDQDLRTDPSTHDLDTSRARHEISPYDRNTIECARLTAAARATASGTSQELVGLTFGDITPVGLKDALARGLDSTLQVLPPSGVEVDGRVTAQALAAAIRGVEGADLVITTEGAADTYAHETAPRIAELLDWPLITNAQSIEVDGTTLRATRVLDDAIEHVECSLPAVVSVVPEIAPAPIPGLKAVMGAAKKAKKKVTVEDLGLATADLAPRTHTARTTGYVAERRHVRHDGTPQEIADSLISSLQQDGVLA
ncbi:electron transfer flavoprotein subunit beta/FixA family protein [Actinomyces provencensis]|uniref:electron transfer flavoprotein subunit beta/FixA family protein n=1 Tax=Actinomyces provencensis TaxID=1720198 RepID=UPI00096A6DE5|nr:hypothetical protein [Actinomyces provencensis]